MLRKQTGQRLLQSSRTILSVSRLATSIMVLFGVAVAFAADDHNPFAGNAKAAKAGEYEFRINCALCHGLGTAFSAITR